MMEFPTLQFPKMLDFSHVCIYNRINIRNGGKMADTALFTLTAEIIKNLEEIAATTGDNKSAIVRRLIEQEYTRLHPQPISDLDK